MSPPYEIPRIDKSKERECILVVTRGWEEDANRGKLLSVSQVLFWGDGTVLELP